MFAPISVLILAMVSIQAGASLAKGLFPLAGAAGTSSYRLFFAALALWIIWRPWKHKSLNFKSLALYGVSLGLMNLTFYFSLDRIPLGLAVTLEFVGPLVLALISSRKKIDFLWAILAALGIWMVMPRPDLAGATDPIGVLFALTAGVFWALYIHFGKKAGKDLHGGVATTIGMSFAALAAIPFGLVIDGDKIFNLSLLPMGIVVGLLSSAIPYSLEMFSLKRMPTKTFSILLSLEPAIASFIGLLFLGEHLTSLQWLAMIFVISASLGSSLTAEN